MEHTELEAGRGDPPLAQVGGPLLGSQPSHLGPLGGLSCEQGCGLVLFREVLQQAGGQHGGARPGRMLLAVLPLG